MALITLQTIFQDAFPAYALVGSATRSNSRCALPVPLVPVTLHPPREGFRGSLLLLKVHARAWRVWRGLAYTPGAGRPLTPASRNGVWFDWSLTAGLCAADRDAVEGFPWPGRRRGWAQLGSRSHAHQAK